MFHVRNSILLCMQAYSHLSCIASSNNLMGIVQKLDVYKLNSCNYNH